MISLTILPQFSLFATAGIYTQNSCFYPTSFKKIICYLRNLIEFLSSSFFQLFSLSKIIFLPSIPRSTVDVIKHCIFFVFEIVQNAFFPYFVKIRGYVVHHKYGGNSFFSLKSIKRFPPFSRQRLWIFSRPAKNNVWHFCHLIQTQNHPCGPKRLYPKIFSRSFFLAHCFTKISFEFVSVFFVDIPQKTVVFYL